MTMFQGLKSVKSELYQVLEEEDASYVSVNVFEWTDKVDNGKKCFDIEVNLFDKNGVRIDCWVTDIVYNKITASRRLKEVETSVSKYWFANRKEIVLNGLGFYQTREELRELLDLAVLNMVS